MKIESKDPPKNIKDVNVLNSGNKIYNTNTKLRLHKHSHNLHKLTS